MAFGGRSPEEWQHAISPEWRDKIYQYRQKFGPFNPALRMDWAIGRAAAFFASSRSNHVKPDAFCPWPKVEEETASFESVAALIKGVAATNNRKGNGS